MSWGDQVKRRGIDGGVAHVGAPSRSCGEQAGAPVHQARRDLGVIARWGAFWPPGEI